MIEVFGLYILRPWWLLAFPVIAIVGYATLVAVKNYGNWQRVAEARFLEFMHQRGVLVSAKSFGVWPFVLTTAFLMSFALAGPALREPSSNSMRNRDALFIVMDLSQSMLKGGNFASAQAIAASVLQDMLSRPVGMIAYAGEAYLVSAPSYDPEKLETAIAVMDQDIVPDKGSRPEYALEYVGNILSAGHYPSGEVILISDGAGVDPNVEYQAKSLRENGYHLSTVYVPPINPVAGMPDPDPSSLQSLAEIGGGKSFESGESEALSDHLEISGEQMESAETRSLFFKDYGRYLLLFALVAMLPLFRMRGAR